MSDRASAPRPSSILRTAARLAGYVGRHPGLIAASVATMIASAGADLAAPEVVKRAIDGPIREGRASALPLYAAAFAAATILASLIHAARTIASVQAGRLIGMSLRMDVFRHIQRMSLRYFDRHPVGVLTTRVTGDVESIEEFFSSGVAAVFHDILKLVLIIAVLFAIRPRLAVLVVAVVPLLLLVSWIFARRSRTAFGRVRAEIAATNAFTDESLGGIRVTRLFQREAHAARTFGGHVARLLDAHLATVRNFAFFYPAVDSLAALAVALVVHFGSAGILERSFTFGEFFQFYLLIDLFFEPIRSMSENLNVLLQAVVSGERIFKILDTTPEILDPAGARDASAISGHVRFREVHFAYKDDEPVLRGVDFDAPAGSTLALVGPTGAGKSSILSLIGRFYDVKEGQVLVDGLDVREYACRSLRARTAVVLQDVFLFCGSVLDNIRLFDPSIPRERVEAAVRAVHADRAIARLPQGLDAPVGERGANFSAGERQLIAFARALVHEPAILVLDEATSSIDTETERWIQEALVTLRRGRTTIVVAHRLSTIKSADQILVLQRGRVRERGTHDELLRAGGLYRKLYELQVRQETSTRRP
ncbi:MAG: ABC transporter ATP-binding protein [Planctomycetes bacterium]|nr:ABC transporter ATP-binding protein [Planctomycetota bacterium]